MEPLEQVEVDTSPHWILVFWPIGKFCISPQIELHLAPSLANKNGLATTPLFYQLQSVPQVLHHDLP
jgi:hypothetical protein